MKSSGLVLLLCCLALGASPGLRAEGQGLDDLLDLNLDDLLNLKVVSALKAPQTINRVPATVRVITADQIRDRGYFTLEEALADLPGLQFRNILGFNSYTFMRGVPGQNNKILLLVDGIQINELNSGGFYGGGQVNLANVERIEVVYGPASALYGTNAVSGIINIVTQDPRDGSGGRVSAGGGNFDTRTADFRVAAHDPGRDLGFTLSGLFKTTDKGDLRGAEGDFNWTGAMDNFEEDLSLDGKFRYRDFSAGLLVQEKDASRATVQKTADAPLSDHGVNWHIRFLNAWATYAYERDPRWGVRATAYHRDSTVLDDTIPVIELPEEGSAGRQIRYFRPGQLSGSETQISWAPAPGSHFTFGLVLERERLADGYSITVSDSASQRPPRPPDPEMTTDTLVSAYAQGRVALARGLDLFLGVRHDDSSYYGTVDTPRAGLVLNRGRLTAKVLVMEAFRAPKPWDYTDGLGNPGLRPEEMRSFEAAGAWSFSANWRLEVAAYRNRLDNLLTRAEGDEGWRWTNAGRLDTDGAEAALEFRRGPWTGHLNATYTDSINAGGGQEPEIARWGANAGFQYAFSHAVRVAVRGRYLGARDNPKTIPSTGDDRIGDAFILHAALTLRLPRGFDLQVVADNLLDAVYYHPSNLPPSRYRQPQRALRLQVSYAF